jgi:adenosylcobyric acid synthase
MPAVMIQGTGSNVGKSVLVAGLCRAASNRGLSVSPFKPQNMSNNAAVTADGGEIGRAQALQARASKKQSHTDMNPILLKPETETGSQLIIHGKYHSSLKAREYTSIKRQLLAPVLTSFERLKSQSDLVIIEGAGSPAEINLRQNDIANMGFASAASVPVILVGDIDRGGVIAQLVGTNAVLPDSDRDLIEGFIVNKFRGDMRLFDEGYEFIQSRTNWEGFGVLPYFKDAWRLPAEDALDIVSHSPKASTHYKIACLCLSRMANFDDLDPLSQEAEIELIMIKAGQAIPADIDLVLIPGSKSTIDDLSFLREQGWDIDLKAHHRRGGSILGICGGYQMLGTKICDPDGIEGAAGEIEGLGFLQIQTVMQAGKTVRVVSATHFATSLEIKGYEIHLGETSGADCARPFAVIDGRNEGACSQDGRVQGSYVHGLFSQDRFRKAFLDKLGMSVSGFSYDVQIEDTLDRLADHIETYLNVDKIFAIAR